MARTGKTTASTIAKFIAPDDSAIGGDPNTFVERYSKYVHSGDHTSLELKRENKPAFYWVRPYLAPERARIRDYFVSLNLPEDGVTPETLVEAMRRGDPTTERLSLVQKEVVFDCLVGCDDHPTTEDVVGEDGKLRTHHILWKPGTPEPIVYTYENEKGETVAVSAREAMVKDHTLVGNLFEYLFAISNLTETEKN